MDLTSAVDLPSEPEFIRELHSRCTLTEREVLELARELVEARAQNLECELVQVSALEISRVAAIGGIVSKESEVAGVLEALTPHYANPEDFKAAWDTATAASPAPVHALDYYVRVTAQGIILIAELFSETARIASECAADAAKMRQDLLTRSQGSN